MPGLSGPSWPSWLRVPSGKSVTMPPALSRRSVSFMPEAPIPSRWIGNPPTERMNRTQDRYEQRRPRHVVERPPQRNAQEEHVEKTHMVADEQHAARCGNIALPGRPPAQDDRGQDRTEILHELIPDSRVQRAIADRRRPNVRSLPACRRLAALASRLRGGVLPRRAMSAVRRSRAGLPRSGPIMRNLSGRARAMRARVVLRCRGPGGRRLLRRQPGRIDHDRVGGRLHRRDGTGGVAGVALALVARAPTRSSRSRPGPDTRPTRRRARSSSLAVR